MRILIIGSGGREHALAWKLRQSSCTPEIFIAPGNGGTLEEGTNIPVQAGDIPGLMEIIKTYDIDFVVPGPELPLVGGIADACKEAGVPCFGPDAYAAQLEGSKVFAKNIMRASGVPTASFSVFTDYAAAAEYVRQRNCPLVIKADGLAAGKGVVVAKNVDEALEALNSMLLKMEFGEAGQKVLIEEILTGQEVSLLAFCDGEHVLPLPSAQDHKAVFDGDTGPNTGGMGAYSPAPLLPDEDSAAMVDLAIRPVLATLKQQGHPFTGILYAGLMMTRSGPMVLEYNVRFGDPECQPLLMRLQGDLLSVMQACVAGSLDEMEISCSQEASLCIVTAAPGYPGRYPVDIPVTGIGEAEASAPGKVKVFHAGTKAIDGQILSSGGRVLGVTALGGNLAEAQKNAYAALAHVHMEGMHFRTDIGNKGIGASQKMQEG